MNARDCIPKDKCDLLALQRARSLGFRSLNEVLPDLLAWVQDGNWPVAQPTAVLLAGAGQEILPHIKAILSGEDSAWKYFVIELLVGNLGSNELSALRNELERLANNPTQDDRREGVDTQAQAILTAMQADEQSLPHP